jgi:hypothetical protein
MIKKDNLFRLVADLVEMLIEYRCENDILISTLIYYGITKEQLKEWYGIGE